MTVKSPVRFLPDLVPVFPTKPLRIQFQPADFLMVRTLIDTAIRSVEQQPSGKFRDRAYNQLISILDQFDDKLDFRPVNESPRAEPQ